MASELSFGILGTGNIAGQFARGVAESRRCGVVAVGSRRDALAEEFAAEHGVERAFGSYEAVLEEPSVEAVYIALPNSHHHGWTLRALEAGKHVLCEKPIAANAGQAEEMFDLARQRQRVLVEAFMYRTHPQTAAVRQTIAEGTIGELRMLRTSFCFNAGDPAGNVRFDPDLAGGALMDIGCYCVDLAYLLTGESANDVHVTGRVHESGVDEYAVGTLGFPSGVVSSFACGMTVQADNAAHVCGSDGYLAIPWAWKPPMRDATFTVDGQIPPRQSENRDSPKRGREQITVDADVPLFGLEADHFAATVRDGAAPAVSASESIEKMRVLDTLRGQLGLTY